MKKFFIKNMGCKSNQLEGSLIEENLVKNEFEKVANVEDSDIFILNSCTVTHKSDSEAFHILLQAKKKNPGVITVLTGCIAQIEKEKLLENENIDIVLGNGEKLEISKYLIEAKSKMQNEKCHVENLDNINDFHQVLLTDTKKTRASLKIQDGCDHRCSYCIIPFARGKNRSADMDFILEQIKLYEQAGFKEVVLTGIHIGQWECGSRCEPELACEQQDKQGEHNDSDVRVCKANSTGAKRQDLLFLLKQIEEKTNIERFRLGSLNPLEISDEMLEFFKNSKKFCPHFHLSLQSMCDKTLKSMNRHYTVAQSMDLIEKIHNIYPLAFIGSDIIAGFVGESEEDFQITVENLKKSKLTQIHTFPYSIRKGTIAEKMQGHLDSKVKESRAGIIKQISAQKYREFLQKNLGTVQEVLIEKNLDRKTGYFKGVTRNYISVLVEPGADVEQIKNTVQNIKVVQLAEQIFGKFV